MKKDKKFILWFKEIRVKDTKYVGGKNSSLGEMYSTLSKKGVRIPNGFAITAHAYNYLLKKAKIKDDIKRILKGLNVHNLHDLASKGKQVRETILAAEFPPELDKAIIKAYNKLCKEYGDNTDVAVRSSATAEDLPSIDQDSHVLIKVNGHPVYDTIKNIYDEFGDGSNCLIEVASMENNEVEWAKAQQIYKHPAKDKKLYKITTETGREITITGNHSLIVLDQDNLKPKTVKINDLKQNEFVPVTRRISIIDLGEEEIDISYYVSGKDVVCENNLVYIKNNSSNWRIQNPLPQKLKINKDLAYFLGLYCAEGSTYKNNCMMVTNSNKKVMNRTKKFLKDISLYKNQAINKNTIRISCKALVRLLHKLTGKPLNIKGKGRSCKIKQVPNFIFGCNKEIIGSFLAGCFDGDGHIHDKGVIEYCSISKKLIGGIIKLLEMLNINFYLRRKKNAFNIRIPSSYAKKFKDLIKLGHPSKLKRLNKLIENNAKKRIQPEFLNNQIFISDVLSNKIKDCFNDTLGKNQVEVEICLLCNNKLKKSSSYKNRLRFYCKNCKKAFYEEDVKKELVNKYVYYDEKGKFKKGTAPWNKGLIQKEVLSRHQFKKFMVSYGLKDYNKFLNGGVLWDKIRKVEEVDYSGDVYDFTVPGIENFAAGVGGIITHNTASFAGQQETYLNIRGHKALLVACKKCFASLFTNRAISYREDKGFNHFKIALSIGVQKMIRSDLASSGVMFSIDTESGFKDAVLINSSYGLGENIVKGVVNPDEFFVFKPTLKKGFKPIITKNLGTKSVKLIYSTKGNKTTKNVPVQPIKRNKFSITDNEILTLTKWACIIEDHYTKKYKKFMPMDMEWAKDGKTGQLYILQARPETVHSQKDLTVLETYKLKKKGKILAIGKSVGEKIGAGKAMVIKDVKEITKFKKGYVLITEMTDPDWEPIMKIASAIVTNRGGRTCHSAIISRELGIPCIVGTKSATESVKNGQPVTVSCAEGDEGYVYDKILKFEIKKSSLKKFPKTRTEVMMNIGNPDEAFNTSFIPNQGVGLAREEFIVNSYIKIHPLALLYPEKVKSPSAKKRIKNLTIGYKNKADFFVDRLSQGIARIAAAFYPKDVIVRLSDFKTNEYANLIGGKSFEPVESNPMLGWRGASRYYSGTFRKAFALECKAILKCRKEMGLNNIKLMIPMCRTVEEGKKVLAEMAKNGLKRGEDKLEVYVMCEVPSNVILADKFADIFDGFSIGSNDLTQFTLAVDRDSDLVSNIFEERNPAVKALVAEVIKVARKRKKKIGICGQAPSDKPDFAEFLVEKGITSISLNPDTVIKTTLRIAQKEKKMKK